MFGNKKAQSAMEYLMTYGWAILIIAIVLAALFSLGVFSSSSFTGTTCVALSGFLCSNPVLHGGNLVVTLGQATGTSWTPTNTILCFVPSGGTVPSSPTTCLSPDSSNTIVGGLANGQSLGVTFTGLSATTVGSTESGTIWAIYSTVSGGTSYITQMATSTLKGV